MDFWFVAFWVMAISWAVTLWAYYRQREITARAIQLALDINAASEKLIADLLKARET